MYTFRRDLPSWNYTGKIFLQYLEIKNTLMTRTSLLKGKRWNKWTSIFMQLEEKKKKRYFDIIQIDQSVIYFPIILLLWVKLFWNNTGRISLLLPWLLPFFSIPGIVVFILKLKKKLKCFWKQFRFMTSQYKSC